MSEDKPGWWPVDDECRTFHYPNGLPEGGFLTPAAAAIVNDPDAMIPDPEDSAIPLAAKEKRVGTIGHVTDISGRNRGLGLASMLGGMMMLTQGWQRESEIRAQEQYPDQYIGPDHLGRGRKGKPAPLPKNETYERYRGKEISTTLGAFSDEDQAKMDAAAAKRARKAAKLMKEGGS